MRQLLVAYALLLAGPAFADDLYRLETNEAVYFYQGPGAVLVFEAIVAEDSGREVERYSNVSVFVNKDPNRSERVRAHVDAWTDLWGHAHSITTLKRQIAFYDDLKGGTAALTFGKRRPSVDISTIALTGVMDRETTLIPYYRSLIDLDALYGRLAKACALSATADFCAEGRWPDGRFERMASELSTTDGLIEAIKTAAFEIKMERHTDLHFERSYPSKGLDVPQPSGSGGWRRNRRGLKHFEADTPPDWVRIKESAVPLSVTQSVIERITRAEDDAQAKLGQLQQLLDALFGRAQ